MSVPFVDLVAQHRALAAELTAALAAVLERGDFILGEAVATFERAFAAYIGVRHAVGVGNGGDALALALQAARIGPGDEVILPANTYIATALAVSSVGARPVLVDCDPATYTLDVAAVAAALTPRTRAVIPVHLAGQPAAMAPLLDLARARDLVVIEDAAQAHGARYRGRTCGALGALGCFSFYPSKNLGACGDGGMVVTDDAALAARLRLLGNYGQREKYVHVVRGRNSRLDTLQAAILAVKLPHLEAWNAARRRHAARYRELLAGVGDLTFQQPSPEDTPVYHLFIIETARRAALQRYLAARGVQTGIHYPIPIHLQAAYADLGYRPGAFPHAERLAQRALSLPMYPELTDAQIAYVADCIRAFFAQGD
jgi:dTDP-4-amino-4,6-dideoxygalactose transaminase